MNTRNYALLRTIASVLRILGWVALAIGVLGAIIALASAPGALKLVGLILALIIGIGWFVQLYAFGSVLHLLMDIEENTNQMAKPSK